MGDCNNPKEGRCRSDQVGSKNDEDLDLHEEASLHLLMTEQSGEVSRRQRGFLA